MWSASSHPPFHRSYQDCSGTTSNSSWYFWQWQIFRTDLSAKCSWTGKKKSNFWREWKGSRAEIPPSLFTFTETLPGLGCLYWRLVLLHSPQKSIYSGESWHFRAASSGPFYCPSVPRQSNDVNSQRGLLSYGDLLSFPEWCCLTGPSEDGGLFLGWRALALPGSSTMFLLLPFDSLIVNLLGISLTVLFTLLLVFIIVPAIFGVSFGIRKLYMKTLLKIFAVSCAVYK